MSSDLPRYAYRIGNLENEFPFRKDKNWEYILNSNPDAVIVMLGGNDTKPWNWTSSDQFKHDYEALAKELIGAMGGDASKLYVTNGAPAYLDKGKT